MSDDSTALEYISEFYLSSREFNGVPVRTLRKHFGLDLLSAGQLLERLLRAEQIDLLFAMSTQTLTSRRSPTYLTSNSFNF